MTAIQTATLRSPFDRCKEETRHRGDCRLDKTARAKEEARLETSIVRERVREEAIDSPDAQLDR